MGTSPRTADPVGYQGQWGAYTDQSTTPSNALVMGARPYYPTTGRYITPAGTSYTGPVAAIPADGDFYDELGTSASAGALYGKAFRKGAGDLLAMPQFKPGSSDRVKLAGMLDAVPFLGNLKLVLQALTGTDYAAGTPLSPGERVLDGILGLLPFASELLPEAKGALGGARVASVVDEAAPVAANAPVATQAIPPEVAKILAGSGGRLGKQSTRLLNYEIAKGLEDAGYRVIRGGSMGSEEYLAAKNGVGAAYPDITAIKDGRTLRINTVDTVAGGATSQRELDAAARIRTLRPNDLLILIPKER